ncbi:MAG: PAS domain S-box protein [bacterium]
MVQFPIEELSLTEFFENIPLGIIIFDSDWNVKLINENFYRFSVLKQNENDFLTEKNILEEALFENVDLFYELKRLSSGESFEKEVKTFNTISGGEITVVVKGAPFFANRQFMGGVIILEDIQISLEVQREKIIRSKYFTDFLSNISDYFFIADSEGIIKFFPAHDQLISTDFLKENFSRDNEGYFSLKSQSSITALIDSVVESGLGKVSDLPLKVDDKDRIMNTNICPFLDKFKNVQFFVVLFKDVTSIIRERINLESENNELRKYFRLTSSLPDAIVALDPEGRIIYWNDSALKIFGFGKNEVIGKFVGNVLTFFNPDKFKTTLELLQQNKIWNGVISEPIEANRYEYYSVKMTLTGAIENRNILLVCSNVTDDIQTKMLLEEKSKFLENLVELAEELICILDTEGKILFSNISFQSKLGYSNEEFSSINFSDLIDPEVISKGGFELKDFDPSGKISRELILVDKNNEKIFVRAEVSLSSKSESDAMQYSILMTDISVQKAIEKDKVILNSICENSGDGIAVLEDEKTIFVNNHFLSMFELSELAELKEKQLADLIDIDSRKEFIDFVFMRDGSRIIEELKCIGKFGKIFFSKTTFNSYSAADHNFIVIFFKDISKQKTESQLFKESEERYTSIAEIINEFMWVAERRGGKLKTIFYTDAVKRITGYTKDELLNISNLWYKIIHPNDLHNVFTKLKRLYRDLGRSFDEIEYRIFNNLGNIVWIKNKINVLRDTNGTIYRIVGLVSDISVSKRAEEELKKSADNLKKMNETKDRFISIVSHDLRTPFSSILGFTDLLLTDRNLPEDKQVQYITYIQESSKNMLSLVNSLLDWTRLQTGRITFEPERVNARLIVVKAIQMLTGNAIKKNITIESTLSDDIHVHGDENLLLQAFLNLISNAVKFTSTGGTIIISSSPSLGKKQILFCVKDTGTGIRAEDVEKLFRIDAKFTTNGTAGERGSGLGLSLVHDIIQKHGGEIWVESEIGKGSEFKFTIPVSSSRILLVDDAKTDRLLYSKLLKSLIPDYSVIEAENGNEAMEIVKNSPPALVITDHKMPGMDGYEFVKQLNSSEIKYKPPVMVLSSDLDANLIEEYKQLGVEFIFNKPVDLMTFKFSVEKSLKKALFL